MTTAAQSSLSNQVQRIAADLSAHLAQLLKDPPDLATYLRAHAESVIQIIQPAGLAYEMLSGQNFQRVFAHNYDSLRLKSAPAQELAFQRAIKKTADKLQPLFLDANSLPVDMPHGLRPEDAPAPESLALHNQTPFQQVFVPIPLNRKAVGVLHAWFNPADANAANARVALLGHAAAEIEAYLKARRSSDMSQELSRINTYARFLEDVAGDQELDSVAWKLVNYAREAVGCDRVCMMVDSRYGLVAGKGGDFDRFTLQACSGLRRPHPRSEHAEVLKAHAAELLKLAVEAAPEPAGTNKPAAENGGNPTDKKAPEPGTRAAAGIPADSRPKMRIMFTIRDPAKVATRPEAVNRYFEVIPMNWSTVLPLYDRENRVCGTLLFEGQQSTEKIAPLFAQMRDLAVSGGRALSTALVWNRRRALRSARVLMRWRDTLVRTPSRRLFLKYGLPLLLLVGVLAFPYPYRVRGDATLRPAQVQTVAALTSGRLMEVSAREGSRVKKGQVLCVLDSADLELQLRQVEQDIQRTQTESNLNLRDDRSEGRMQMARLNAQKFETLAEKIRRDISLTVIRAPFDGVLVGPQDLTQRKGQVVKMGETVAEIVDPSHWEVKVSVREQDVPTLMTEVNQRREADPKASIPGELILTAHPDQVFSFALSDPAAFAHRLDTTAGKYNFSAIFPIQTDDPALTTVGTERELKTGYTGRARLTCGKRSIARILFGDFARFIKVNFF